MRIIAEMNAERNFRAEAAKLGIGPEAVDLHVAVQDRGFRQLTSILLDMRDCDVKSK